MRQAMTPAEFALWQKLRSRNLEGLRFRRQAPLGPYIVDFFCPELKLVVEVDGGQHWRSHNARNDALRDAWMARQGIAVIRFSNGEVLDNTPGACDAILQAAIELRSNPSPKTAAASHRRFSALPQGEG
jgi:very-short-patch-repair endonuclease